MLYSVVLAVAAFFAIKLGAYSWWIGRLGTSWRAACGWAALRVALGYAAGAGLLWFFSFFPRQNRLGIPEMFGSPFVTYAVSYAPLRLAEWALIARLASGAAIRHPGWIFIGAGLSFLTDLAGFALISTALGGIC